MSSLGSSWVLKGEWYLQLDQMGAGKPSDQRE